jgi:hypothetical protein
MSLNSKYNIYIYKKTNKTKESNQKISSFFPRLINNRRKFTVNAEAEKTETIQTERSSIFLFCRIFSQLKRPQSQIGGGGGGGTLQTGL